MIELFDTEPFERGEAASVARRSQSVATEAKALKPTENRDKSPSSAGSVAGVASVANLREGVKRLASLPCPFFLERARWQQLVADAQSFERCWLAEAVRAGWTETEIFGCYRRPWFGRGDYQGLVILLAGRPVTELDEKGARIQCRLNITQHFMLVQPVRGGGWMRFDRSLALPMWAAFDPEYLKCAV